MDVRQKRVKLVLEAEEVKASVFFFPRLHKLVQIPLQIVNICIHQSGSHEIMHVAQTLGHGRFLGSLSVFLAEGYGFFAGTVPTLDNGEEIGRFITIDGDVEQLGNSFGKFLLGGLEVGTEEDGIGDSCVVDDCVDSLGVVVEFLNAIIILRKLSSGQFILEPTSLRLDICLILYLCVNEGFLAGGLFYPLRHRVIYPFHSLFEDPALLEVIVPCEVVLRVGYVSFLPKTIEFLIQRVYHYHILIS